MKPYIQVVAGIIFHEDRVLIAQRSTGIFSGFWEFPGGKMERGESVVEALARELFEELELELTEFRSLLEYGYAFPSVNVDLHFLEGRLERKTNLVSHVHQALAWVGMDEISKYTFLVSNQPILDLIRHS